MTSAAAHEEEKVEWMDDANAPVTNKDKDNAGGPSAGGGSEPTT